MPRMVDVFDLAQAAARLDRIQQLIDAFAKAHGDMIEQQDIAERLHREVVIARTAIEPSLKPNTRR